MTLQEAKFKAAALGNPNSIVQQQESGALSEADFIVEVQRLAAESGDPAINPGAAGVDEIVAPELSEGIEHALKIYEDTLRFEKAYEHFKDHYDELYKDGIKEATKDWGTRFAADTNDAAGGASGIENKEEAIKFLTEDTNFVASKTTMKRFGMLTGYNMQYQLPTALDVTVDPQKWFEKGWGKRFWTGAPTEGDRDRAQDAANLKFIQNPILTTGLRGVSDYVPDNFENLQMPEGTHSSLANLGRLAEGWLTLGADPDFHDRNAVTNENRVFELSGEAGIASGVGGLFTATNMDFERSVVLGKHPYLQKMGREKYKVGQRGYDVEVRSGRSGHLLDPNYVFALGNQGVADWDALRDAANAIGNAATTLLSEGGLLNQKPFNLLQMRESVFSPWLADNWFYPKETDQPDGSGLRKIDGVPGGGTPHRLYQFPVLPYDTMVSDALAKKYNDAWDSLEADEDDREAARQKGVDIDALRTSFRDTSYDAAKEAVKAAWGELYEGFVAKTNELHGLHVQILRYLELRWGGNVDLLFKDEGGALYDEGWEKNLARDVERILDAFGAGKLKDKTPAQRREGVLGDTEERFDNLSEEAQKKAVNYKTLRPLDMQCFLMENIDLISHLKESENRIGGYDNLIRLRGDPGTTISKLQSGGRIDAAEQLLNLSPTVYGMLVPYVKIYRVDYEKEDDGEDSSLRPVVQTEMPIPNFLDPQDPSIMLGTASRPRGWGLQSLTWQLDGVQPAEVDNNISATLNFYFQTMEDLFRGSAATWRHKKTSAEISGRVAGQIDEYGRPLLNPLDLLLSSRSQLRKETDEDALEDGDSHLSDAEKKALEAAEARAYKGADYRIKVVAGWATPPNLELLLDTLENPNNLPRPNLLAQLERAIESTRITLYLQQVRHNLTFNENGSIVLSIDYQAALTGMLTSNKLDILGSNDVKYKSRLQTLNSRIKKRESTITSIRETAIREAAAADASDISDNPAVKEIKKSIKKLIEEKKKIINANKSQKYKSFLSRLYGRPSTIDDPFGINAPCKVAPKIYVVEVDPNELLRPPLSEEDDPQVRADRAARRMMADYTQRGFMIREMLNYKDVGNTDLDMVIRSVEEKDTEDKDKWEKKLAEQWEKNVRANTNIFIPYFYLGDLIDTIIENNATIGSASRKGAVANYLTFLAQIDVINPLLLHLLDKPEELVRANSVDVTEVVQQLRNRGLIISQKTVKKRINIGSIPVSVDQFNIWFKNNVIKKQRNTYYLMHFIKDICAQLITDSLQHACFNENVINDIRFDTSIIHFNNKDSDSGAPKVRPLPGYAEYAVDVDELAGHIGATKPDNDIPSIPPQSMRPEDKNKYDLTSALVVYSTDSVPSARHGRDGYRADLRDGIYHNYIGAPAGLLKRVNFSRYDQPYVREAKIQKYGNLGAEQLRELFSAQLEMVGNTLFKNGQYTFIEPSAVGTDPELARLLGIGGYFLVTGVSHTIGPSGYNVTVAALQQELPIGDTALGTQVGALAYEISPELNPATFERGDDGNRFVKEEPPTGVGLEDQSSRQEAGVEEPPTLTDEQVDTGRLVNQALAQEGASIGGEAGTVISTSTGLPNRR